MGMVDVFVQVLSSDASCTLLDDYVGGRRRHVAFWNTLPATGDEETFLFNSTLEYCVSYFVKFLFGEREHLPSLCF
jgi:hypothetical protein